MEDKKKLFEKQSIEIDENINIYGSNLKKDKSFSSDNFSIPKKYFTNINSKTKNDIKVTDFSINPIC